MNLWEARAAIFFKPVFSNYLKLCNSQFHTNHLIESDEFQVERTLFLNITLQFWVPLYNVGLIKTSIICFIWGHIHLDCFQKYVAILSLGFAFYLITRHAPFIYLYSLSNQTKVLEQALGRTMPYFSSGTIVGLDIWWLEGLEYV